MIHDVPSRNDTRRSTIETLRVALEEEARLAPALLEKQQNAMKEAVDALTEASSDVRENLASLSLGTKSICMCVGAI